MRVLLGWGPGEGPVGGSSWQGGGRGLGELEAGDPGLGLRPELEASLGKRDQ